MYIYIYNAKGGFVTLSLDLLCGKKKRTLMCPLKVILICDGVGTSDISQALAIPLNYT